MIKRNVKESVQEGLASKEFNVPVSKTPAVMKSIWDIDPAPLEDYEDLKRKSPAAKYLKVLSAFITVMVLWGIFWQVRNHLVPLVFSSLVSASQEASFTLAQIRSSAYAFQGDSSDDLVSSVDDRRAAANALEVLVGQFSERQKRTDDSSADLLSSVDDRRAAASALEILAEQFPEKQKQNDEPVWEESLGPAEGPTDSPSELHRKLLSDFDHPTTY